MSQSGHIPATAGEVRALGIVSARSAAFDRRAALIFALTLAQALALAHLYPGQRFDPDLLAYFTYFRNWVSDDRVLQQLPYFTAPKLLLVATLGPLADATLAFYCTMLVSATLGSVLYLLWRDHFGRTTAIAASLFLLVDPSKAMLTLRSSADLYLAFLLFLAVLLCDRGRVLAAATALLGAALVKPVAVPCAAYFLLAARPVRRRLLAVAIPLLAVPITLLGNHALLGDALGGTQFFAEFASMGGNAAIGWEGVIHYALWSQLVKARFLATASFGVVGILLWIDADRARLKQPLLLMPLLFLAGYLTLGLVTRFPPYFRYFWPLEIWFLPFIVFGALEGARRIAAGTRWLQRAIVAVVLVLLADSFVGRFIDYHRDYARPAEHAMRFADAAREILRAGRQPGSTVLVPLGLLPFMMWEFSDAARDRLVYTAEQVARDSTPLHPDWVLHIPGMYTDDGARTRVAAIIADGSLTIVMRDERAALLGPAGAGTRSGGAVQSEGE